jgi:hypothetical protein
MPTHGTHELIDDHMNKPILSTGCTRSCSILDRPRKHHCIWRSVTPSTVGTTRTLDDNESRESERYRQEEEEETTPNPNTKGDKSPVITRGHTETKRVVIRRPIGYRPKNRS